MGVFACAVCGDPWAWDSHSIAGMMRKHDCPGPPKVPDGEPVRCPFCGQPDPTWRAADLARGKRGLSPGPGVDYHCTGAFYGAS